MADTVNIDVGQLTEAQQAALQTYTSVTNQDLSAAIALLQRCQWNVQIAISKFFDGDAPDPVIEEAQAAIASSPPQRSTHRATLLDDLDASGRSITRSQREPAPRIVPQPENRNVYKPPFLLSVLLSPFSLVYRLLSSSLSAFGYLVPFLPRILSSLYQRNPSRGARSNTIGRRPLNPRDTAARFIREFEEGYGSHSLKFFENGYAQAYDLAKKDLKFLLVVLMSPEHDDTTTFVRETLLATEVTDFINNTQNNIILWAGNVQDSEAYQVSSALNCTKFPFAALVVHTPQDSSTSMSTVARISGLLPPSAFVARLQTAIAQQSTTLDRVRRARAEQEASRNLRQEQNSAYERSLAQDRERARQRREADAAKLRAKQEAKSKAEKEERLVRQQTEWKRWRLGRIAPEPGSEVKNATRISIRMPNGERIVRRFAADIDMEELYAYVECHDLQSKNSSSSQAARPQDYNHVYRFKLVTPMPRTAYEPDNSTTIAAAIGRSGNLIVEPISEEEDQD
ncbi:MAG: hypothetical protein MMC33_003338 [Icmadophila ericetorum]|nr:hypothetical protein [Icmadophila ericetorum]